MTASNEHVPVLIVGGGYGGLASSLFLAAAGVPSLLVDRHAAISVQGRARGINQRSMEIYRPLGLQDVLTATGAPFAADAGIARCHTLAEPWEWLYDPELDPTAAGASPTGFVLADQNTVEPILRSAAARRGAQHRLRTELLTHTRDEDGVTARLQNCDSGEQVTLRADYLIAADGNTSTIRDQVGISRTGPGTTQHWISIVFDADLTGVVGHRALFWILLNEQLGFAGFVATATPGCWALSLTYDPRTTIPGDFTDQRCSDLVRIAVGRDELAVRIVDVASWDEAVAVANTYRSGRVFLVGDSAHVWPPAGAMGANAAVQDAHNLAWKLAAVLAGTAGDALLDSYQDERRPVAQALADLTMRRQAARFGGGLDDDVDDLVCTLGQRYRSTAVLGTVPAAPFGAAVPDKPEVGARMPHHWLHRGGDQVSTHDLFGYGFVVLTDQTGHNWIAAADAATHPEMLVVAHRICTSPGDADLLDTEPTPLLAALPPGAAVLVRPDGYVGWWAGYQISDSDRLFVRRLWW